VLVLPAGGDVALLNDPLSTVEARPEQWMLKDFFKVEKPRAVSVTHTNDAQNWKVTRETESGELKLANPQEGETVDAVKLGSISSVLSYPSFVDVAAPTAKPEDTGLANPVTAVIETFDGFTYTVKVGGKAGEENYHMQVAVAGSFAREREPGKDEKPEDKEKLDKEFKDKVAKLEEKLKNEKRFEPWTYVVSKWTVESLLKERKDLMQEKKEEPAKPDDGTAVPPFPPTPPAAPTQ
jgi:hypothetical protein